MWHISADVSVFVYIYLESFFGEIFNAPLSKELHVCMILSLLSYYKRMIKYPAAGNGRTNHRESLLCPIFFATSAGVHILRVDDAKFPFDLCYFFWQER